MSTISEKQYIRLENNNAFSSKSNLRSRSAACLTICAPDIHSFHEITRSIEVCRDLIKTSLDNIALSHYDSIVFLQLTLRTLHTLVDHNEVVVGGGCTEIHFAQWIRQKLLSETSTRLNEVVKVIADAFDQLAELELVTHNRISILKRDKEYSSHENFTVNNDEHILEPLQPKLNAIRAAIEMTKLLLLCSTVFSDNSF
jgi:hypothetical protein